ncbi:hypothetical protein B0I35DRAFT_407853 [Stachybotrys elegans]|uniref:Zn(2)-C6 fungal-type domain-containing protein n=1 Tax=Stachybotrys elegans TaxID=80388 RepID=A0A8K0SRQ6_9HYPO|nr:hypothetical protein B0I35DRAFT_407853 [Stachybotrys elegans]
MFNTWKYDPETDEVQSLRQAFDPISARSSQHQACDRCHEKKLKCSGEKDGCERCISSQKRCEYTRSGSRSSRRGKKSSSSSSSRQVEESSSSRHSRPSRARAGHSGRHSSSAGPSTSYPDDSEGMLSTLDFSSLGPEDAFDLNSLSDTSPSMHGYYQMQHGHSNPHSSYGQYHSYGQAVTSAALDPRYVSSTADDDYGQPQYHYSSYQQPPDARYWPQGR